ncbi:hypothetical protein AB205_0202520 [Aquarana catesbeiana]|uniref:Uncharacterized protein n=1 Tax=Aquarana catesbeiana TaxID=8400 RepID=A0A2G9Q599_AQUCT|nr:hypothetical protein AB205_0202520 [Aquarana catesbeiana]
MHTVCQHVLSAIRGYQGTRFGGATPLVGERRGCIPKTSLLIPHDVR